MALTLGVSKDLSYEYARKKQRQVEQSIPSSLNDSGTGFINDKGRMNLIHQSDQIELSNWHLPPKYIEIFDQSNDIFKELTINFSKLQEEQQKRITPKFDETENRIIDNTIFSIISDMTSKLKEIEVNIKHIAYEKTPSPQEQQVKDNMKQVVVDKLNDFTNKLKQNEELYLKKYKEMNHEDLLQSQAQMTSDRKEKQPQNDFIQKHMKDSDDIRMQRNKDIASLCNSINSLTQIFKDIQALVMHQGTIIDRIDYNIAQTKLNVVEAHEELIKADESSQSSLLRNINLFLILLISIIGILIILKIFR